MMTVRVRERENFRRSSSPAAQPDQPFAFTIPSPLGLGTLGGFPVFIWKPNALWLPWWSCGWLHLPVQGVLVWSLVGEVRSHTSGPKYQNMTQKQYCNKFNKGSKNGPHQKNLIKKNSLIHIAPHWLLAWLPSIPHTHLLNLRINTATLILTFTSVHALGLLHPLAPQSMGLPPPPLSDLGNSHKDSSNTWNLLNTHLCPRDLQSKFNLTLLTTL